MDSLESTHFDICQLYKFAYNAGIMSYQRLLILMNVLVQFNFYIFYVSTIKIKVHCYFANWLTAIFELKNQLLNRVKKFHFIHRLLLGSLNSTPNALGHFFPSWQISEKSHFCSSRDKEFLVDFTKKKPFKLSSKVPDHPGQNFQKVFHRSQSLV